VTSAWTQTRAGGEFQVNSTTAGNQRYASVGRDAAGNFVVVWDDQSDDIVKGQRFDPAGSRVGAEFAVNTAVYGYFPAVAMGPAGDFVVVWSDFTDGDSSGIRGRLFDAAANPLGVEFQVNTFTTGGQLFANVARDGSGNFVVAWWSYLQDGSGYAMVGRRFDAQGNGRGSEFVVNTFTTGNQFFSDISSDAAGNFVIAWTSYPGTDGSGLSVNGQRYDSNGVPQGGEFVVNSYTTGDQASVGVAHAPDGSFVVAFMSDQFDGVGDVIAKRYDASGNTIGAEFVANTTTAGQQGYPDIAMDTQGNFVVSWWDPANDGSSLGVFARRFLADGTPRGDDFQVNTYTTGPQVPDRMASAVASDEVGNFVLTWRSPTPLLDEDIFAQRYGGLHPSALSADPTGNGVIEPGETAEVGPSWRNFNGAAQSFGGTLGNLGGPAGPTYTIDDGVADHGTVANGAASACTDCYSVTVSGTRPALHWDATALETITPDDQGQMKTWTLHIGNSFADVPTSSSYYRFAETLLHTRVTGGCTATSYCPATSASRQQMAIFVLKAKEGGDYSPPACGATPLFPDVPVTSPYCAWVEELSRRGVVGSCGGGNYCPTNVVTRAQMPIFVLKTLDPAIDPPACGTPMFGDVPATSPYCRWIEELVRRAVVTGCGGGNYCPNNPVTRGQMAVFLTVSFSLALYGL
jgi:hypothetical protein